MGSQGIKGFLTWGGEEGDEFHNQGGRSCSIHQNAFLAAVT